MFPESKIFLPNKNLQSVNLDSQKNTRINSVIKSFINSLIRKQRFFFFGRCTLASSLEEADVHRVCTSCSGSEAALGQLLFDIEARWQGAADTATGEVAASAKSSQDSKRHDEPIKDAHSQDPRRQGEQNNDLPVKKSTTKTLPGKPSEPRRNRRIANPHVFPLNISSCTINRNDIFGLHNPSLWPVPLRLSYFDSIFTAAASAAKFSKLYISSASERAFLGFLAIFWLLNSLQKRYFSTQEFTRFEIIPLSILGCDQQNLENFLSYFKWSVHRLAHVFAYGWSKASHKRKRTLLEAPTGTLLFYYKDIKKKMIKGVACIWDVGCVHSGFAPYLARIHCPKVRCVHLSSMPKTTLACIWFRNDPCVHPFFRVTKTQHLDPDIRNFGFYYRGWTTEDGTERQHRQGSGCMRNESSRF